MSDIDIVIPWVDGSDPAWRAARAAATPGAGDDASEARYRDWGTLRYWFRSVEQFAPWVRKIHFITWGHLPAWLDTEHPKLHIVRHADYLPEAYRPTFNANTIELNFHRIEGLAEQFILFNDDCFLGRPARATDFFRGGVPRDMAALALPALEPISHLILNALMLINARYRPHEVIARHPFKWLTLRYGAGKLLKTCLLLPWSNFPGIRDHHMPQGYLRSRFAEAWERWPETLDTTCRNRFRSLSDVSEWLIRYDTLCRGDFDPIGYNDCRQMTLSDDCEALCQTIEQQRCRMFCLHDDAAIRDFERVSARLCTAFERIFPNPSSYEK